MPPEAPAAPAEASVAPPISAPRANASPQVAGTNPVTPWAAKPGPVKPSGSMMPPAGAAEAAALEA